MSEKDEKILNFAMEIFNIKYKKDLALFLGYSEFMPMDWKKKGIRHACKEKIQEALDKEFEENPINSNDSRRIRYLELFVALDIERDEDYEYKKVFNNHIKNMSGVLINDNNGTIHIDLNKKDFTGDGDSVKKVISLLPYASNNFLDNMIEKLERIKEITDDDKR